MKIGYIRVSSLDQKLDRQEEVLKNLEIEKFFKEKASGASTKNREQLNEMLSYAREGDVIYIESISRLARNTGDLLTIVDRLKKQGVDLVSVKENIDTTTPQGSFILTVFGALSQLERESIKERQKEGIEIARYKGIKFGRPRIGITDIFKKAYLQWKNGAITAVQARKNCGMTAPTFYRRVKEFEKEKKNND